MSEIQFNRARQIEIINITGEEKFISINQFSLISLFIEIFYHVQLQFPYEQVISFLLILFITK